MIDPLLLFVTFNLFIMAGLLIYLAYVQSEFNKERIEFSKERERLMKAIMAKNLQDFTTNEIISKNEPSEVTPPEFVPVEEAEEKLFNDIISKQIQ